ncbi:MAG: NAD-dependent epimerase/dehydratase family protein [Dehalococcoidales bacterium]|nr:NAD-dependent epimerase/dehydratase family protein [Dehalococcoidales bacterium]
MAKLITGGLGFIGSHLARKLVDMGKEVIILDVTDNTGLIDDFKNKVTVVRGDLGNRADIINLFKENRIETVFHTGALLSASAESSPLTAYAVNSSGTLYILEAARLFQAQQVILISSISTYGPGVEERVHDDTVQRPVTIYGVTKVSSELMGEYYHTRFGVNFRGLRLPSVIGPGRGGGGASAYSSLMVQEAAAGRPYSVFVDEDARIPLLYIEDAVQAMISLESAPESSLKRRVYNIEGFSPTAGELAAAIKKHIPSARITFHPEEAMLQIVRSWPREMDGSRARLDWGWQTRYDCEASLKHFIRTFGENRTLYDRTDNS